MNQVCNPVWFRARWKNFLPGTFTSLQLQYLPLLIVIHCIFLCHSQFYVLYWHSASLMYRFVMCFFICHVCLRVNDFISAKITGYHTCRKVRFTNRYAIHIYCYMAFVMSYPLYDLEHDIWTRTDKWYVMKNDMLWYVYRILQQRK